MTMMVEGGIMMPRVPPPATTPAARRSEYPNFFIDGYATFAQVADEGVGGAEQFLRHAGARHEVAHQDEQRHHGQRVIAPRLVELGLRHRERHRPVPVAHVGVAGDADDGHGEGDGHAQAAEQHHHGEADQPLDHRRSTTLWRWITPASARVAAMKYTKGP